MKKAMVIVLSMLLVLVVGQSVFAKNYVGLTLGYGNLQGDYYDVASEDEWHSFDLVDNGFKVALYGNYYLTDKISLAGEMGIDVMSGHSEHSYHDETMEEGRSSSFPSDYKYTKFDFRLFGRYDVYKWNTGNVGVQLGLMNSTNFYKYYDEGEEKWYEDYNSSTLFVALGAYADIEVLPKLNAYADLKFPIGFWNKNYANDQGLLKVFIYDVILGVTYEISPNIHLGIEGSISNANYGGLDAALEKKLDKEDNRTEDTSSYFNFSIGAKVGYSF